ncbi:MAG: 3-hydroxybutyryl-CoA dehydrogenase, partial [Actinomycetota bacterium]|nr:3-hydroxybutyryl-CoA dehydrogenase [Actinomycetota bacterium]
MPTIGVIGAGLMGGGIAQVSAVAGYDVVLRDVDETAVQRGLHGIEKSVGKLVEKERLTGAEATAALARISVTTDLAAVAEVDMVVEAVFEKLEIKTELFAALDAICRPDAVLATNTSAIPVTTIAAATSRPESVVGTHFFSPVPLMALCEIVRGYKTSEDTVA